MLLCELVDVVVVVLDGSGAEMLELFVVLLMQFDCGECAE